MYLMTYPCPMMPTHAQVHAGYEGAHEGSLAAALIVEAHKFDVEDPVRETDAIHNDVSEHGRQYHHPAPAAILNKESWDIRGRDYYETLMY